ADSGTHSLTFFFQAEDGIRVFHVTGVQTCALPISVNSLRFLFRAGGRRASERFTLGSSTTLWQAPVADGRNQAIVQISRASPHRSEERRVGKAWTAKVRHVMYGSQDRMRR